MSDCCKTWFFCVVILSITSHNIILAENGDVMDISILSITSECLQNSWFSDGILCIMSHNIILEENGDVMDIVIISIT